jgi:REP element-mobilizing transposase RayT
MPNHIHGIIQIQNPNVGATLAVALNPNTVAPGAVAAPGVTVASRATVKVAPTTVGCIVGTYKSLVFKKCLEISKLKNYILGRLWQRNYYEHIIRNEAEYAKIAEYIQNNPILWRKDCFNTSISHL